MAYLLVCMGDVPRAESYGMALVWISPHQIQVSTMEEVVGDTVHLYIQWTRLAIYSCTATQRLQSYTPPQGQAHRCLASRKGGGEPLWAD